MVRENVAEAVLLAESVTLTVKLGVLADEGVPESTPPLDRLRLAAARLAAPPVTVHV